VIIRRSGVFALSVVIVALAAYIVASRGGYLERLKPRLLPRSPDRVRISSGDFPAGVAAPVGDLASIPLRPTLIGFVPRGSAATLLLAAGGAVTHVADAQKPSPTPGLFRSGYALDTRAVLFTRPEDLERALAFGGEKGGVDLALLSVDRLAEHWKALRDASPRVEMLVGRSRGQEALAAVGVHSLAELRGKRIAAYSESSSYYFALWLLSRAGLAPGDVRWVELASAMDAGTALREGRADAAVGYHGDVALAAKDRGGQVLATTADAPHLVATVLVARGDFAARYPDAIRRVMRGLLDADRAVQKDPLPAARLLGEVAPYLGDPRDALGSAPPASLKDNLTFFGLSGEAPVTNDELFHSAGLLFAKLGKSGAPPPSEDTRDLGPLKSIAETHSP
jgi:ABC-type nitrate/sulfonate/bicarbonate transport system substrate-binding protein